MIRFLPDTWRDALLRPLAMAAPDGNVYVEIIAPDWRFLFIFALALAWVIIVVRTRAKPAASPVVLLGGFIALTFVPWLVTSGNGRYFIAPLLAAGPLCIALVYRLPLTVAMRTALAVSAVGLQIFVVCDANPFRWWGLAEWKSPPAFEIEDNRELLSQPATYVTISSISYSLIAPRFPASSRWINLTSQRGEGDPSDDGRRTRRLLDGSESLKLIFPSLAGEATSDNRPSPHLAAAVNQLLEAHRLWISQGAQCRLLRSRGLAMMTSRKVTQVSSDVERHTGFWICPLQRLPGPASPDLHPLPADADATFSKVESMCPRFFRQGEAATRAIPSGAMRSYVSSDMKVYVLSDGQVFYKYLKALNPERIGTTDEIVRDGFRMSCDHIRGRSGLPWERGL